jgi:hypothetical protein
MGSMVAGALMLVSIGILMAHAMSAFGPSHSRWGTR